MTRVRDSSLVKKRRQELGLQIKECSSAIERSAAFWSMMEGGFVPDHDRRCQVARALGTAPEKLWPWEYDADHALPQEAGA